MLSCVFYRWAGAKTCPEAQYTPGWVGTLSESSSSSKHQPEFCLRWRKFLPKDSFSVLWRCEELVVVYSHLLLGFVCWFGEQDKDHLQCFQALIPSSPFFSLCISLEQDCSRQGCWWWAGQAANTISSESTASHTCHPEEQSHNAVKSCRTMEIIRSPQTGDITAYIWCQIPVWIEVAQASGP